VRVPDTAASIKRTKLKFTRHLQLASDVVSAWLCALYGILIIFPPVKIFFDTFITMNQPLLRRREHYVWQDISLQHEKILPEDLKSRPSPYPIVCTNSPRELPYLHLPTPQGRETISRVQVVRCWYTVPHPRLTHHAIFQEQSPTYSRQL
jgi:hypothetical protein